MLPRYRNKPLAPAFWPAALSRPPPAKSTRLNARGASATRTARLVVNRTRHNAFRTPSCVVTVDYHTLHSRLSPRAVSLLTASFLSVICFSYPPTSDLHISTRAKSSTRRSH
ncbi:hypothetical protein BT67DRAFT_197795 [Trichocladium antarcticum]|uniref:Uncharacterized protein n=1 Tax=Trichocladium antarcticum TaxID=1450529 RepID=A0AAN6ZFZ7_9PEZI|nr:hypothetical protein BT67DRAFT_197795 [Trichocladium antarcticum]